MFFGGFFIKDFDSKAFAEEYQPDISNWPKTLKNSFRDFLSLKDLRAIKPARDWLILAVFLFFGFGFLFFERRFTHFVPNFFWGFAFITALYGAWLARAVMPPWLVTTVLICFGVRFGMDLLIAPTMQSFQSKPMQRTLAYVFPFLTICLCFVVERTLVQRRILVTQSRIRTAFLGFATFLILADALAFELIPNHWYQILICLTALNAVLLKLRAAKTQHPFRLMLLNVFALACCIWMFRHLFVIASRGATISALASLGYFAWYVRREWKLFPLLLVISVSSALAWNSLFEDSTTYRRMRASVLTVNRAISRRLTLETRYATYQMRKQIFILENQLALLFPNRDPRKADVSHESLASNNAIEEKSSLPLVNRSQTARLREERTASRTQTQKIPPQSQSQTNAPRLRSDSIDYAASFEALYPPPDFESAPYSEAIDGDNPLHDGTSRDYDFASAVPNLWWRYYVWRDAIREWVANPIFGVGFKAIFNSVTVQRTMGQPDNYQDLDLHNSWLQVLHRGGLFLAIPVFLFWMFFFAAASEGLRTPLIFFFLHSMTNVSFETPHFAFATYITLALLVLLGAGTLKRRSTLSLETNYHD